MRARARGGGELAGGGEGRGAGMMQCLATRRCAHAQGTTREVGGAGGGKRGEAGRQLLASYGPNGWQPKLPLG